MGGRRVIGGMVLAAGAGTRYGAVKQLARIDGRTLVEWAVAAMAAAPVDRVVVVLGAEAERIQAEADLDGAEVVVASGWSEGIAASLRAGLGRLREGTEAIVITLADQPRVGAAAIAAVLERLAGPELAVRATYDGAPGHPVAVKSELYDELAALAGDGGARDLLARAGVATVECAGLADGRDVDTPADLEALGGEPAMEATR